MGWWTEMATQHNCAECRHLKRTSPTQVFLLCTYWAHPSHGTQAYDWTCRHCHLQPEAPAFHKFEPRAVSAHA